MEKELSKAWDELVVEVFIGSNHAFYGSLLCSVDVQWDESIPTAVVNPDMYIKWNPHFFLQLPRATRKFVLIHELEHIARLHSLRRGERDKKDWNIACDHEINLAQLADGLTHEGTKPYADPAYHGKSAEEIYDIIHAREDKDDDPEAGNGSWGDGSMDMEEGTGNADGGPEPDSTGMTQEQKTRMLNAVIRANQSAKLAGSDTSAIDSILDTFLKPKVAWHDHLRKYLTDKLKRKLDWKHRNRRFPNVFIPARKKATNGLTDITFYLDTSGSITDLMVQILNSEVKYVFDTYQPKNLTIVQFDTQIRHEVVYQRGTKIKKVKVVGRGGTDLRCVHDHIKKNKPQVAVVLTDMYCEPMDVINGLEIMWVVFDNPYANVNQGKLCHVKTG